MKKYDRKLIFIIISVLLASNIYSQTIKIGQSAKEIKSLIEWSTNQHNQPDSYGNRSNSYWTWDVKYYDGEIEYVVQCYQKQLLVDLMETVDYCNYYMMQNSKLSYILTQYENISLDKLKKNYDRNHGKNYINGLYFSDDFEHYTKIYLSDNGLATTEWKNTVISELPTSIQETIRIKRDAYHKEKELKQEKEQQELQAQEQNDMQERLKTIYVCDDFYEGLAKIGIKADEMNYGYGKILYGFIDTKGNYVIEPKYQKAYSFKDGYALVNKDPMVVKNWEFINQNGINVFDKKFSDAYGFREGLAKVSINDQWSFIDKTGNLIFQPKYEEVGNFKEGFAKVKLNGKWGFIDKSGSEVIKPQYNYVEDFSNGIAIVSKSIDYHYTEYGFIDKQGNYIVKSEKEGVVFKIESNFKNGYAIIKKGYRTGNGYGSYSYDSYGIVSMDGKFKFMSEVIDLRSFNEQGLAIAQVYRGRKYGFVNTKLKWIIKPIYDKVEKFREGLAKVQINNEWSFIDYSGQVVINKDILNSKNQIKISDTYEFSTGFYEGLAIVKTKQGLGYIDKVGNWVIEPNFIDAQPFKDGIARVKISGKKGWNYIDKEGNILFNKFL